MSASHHDREEETLITYFQQMLAEVDDEEFAGEVQASSGGLEAKPAAASAYSEQSNQQVLAHANAAIVAGHNDVLTPFAPTVSATSDPSTPSTTPFASATPFAPTTPSVSAAGSDATATEQGFPRQVAQTEQAAQEEGIENPSGGLQRISTQDMLSQEMVMVSDVNAMDRAIAKQNTDSYSQRTNAEYQEEQSSYGYSPTATTTTDAAIVTATATATAAAAEGAATVATSTFAIDSAVPAVTPIAPSLQPQPQLQPQEQSVSATTLEYAQPSESLQRLLANIDTNTEVATATKIAEPEVATATATATVVAEPEVAVETETAVAEPEMAVETETVVAEPEVVVETETAIAEPEVAIATATKVAEPEVAVATAVAEPEVATVVAPAPVITDVAAKPVLRQEVFNVQALSPQERMAARIQQIAATWENVDLGEQFQVLFFLVQGVRFAVPLIDLGGIFECDKLTQLFGKPSWFMGITDIRGTKINIVDTLRWVMPEIGDSPDKYPYLISLGTSSWSIGCDVLEGNRTLTRSQIKWREIPGSRPWLAGIVTADKCAVLHVKALISLFEAGADIMDLNKNLDDKKK